MKILITGGAGFVGRHLASALIQRGDAVRVLDVLVPEVHANGARNGGQRPAELHPDVEFIEADVRDADSVRQALKGVDAVFHQAAEVGVGRSMYEIPRFVATNSLGTGVLLQEIVERRRQVRKLVVASSMTLYGEGCGCCPEHGLVEPHLRSLAQLEQGEWGSRCPHCQREVAAAPTPETKLPAPTSVYAVSKRGQEELCLAVGRAYGIPTVALRYFNIYGPGQALGNPYTGIVSIFCNRLLNDQPVQIYEDGCQSRDFVHVSDVVQANLLALNADEANNQAFNVSSGELWTVLEVAEMVRDNLGGKGQVVVTEQYRAGDIRHCHADLTCIRQRLGYRPRIGLRRGLPEVIRWARQQQTWSSGSTYQSAEAAGFHRASRELAAYGLLRKPTPQPRSVGALTVEDWEGEDEYGQSTASPAPASPPRGCP
ncbi:MAG: NAD-dependent epimerase/dehydratase family protein [Acidobacteria bacterium]|nr:NAD-dependent epimerase/dehydratase family protein [Acidobacteriota bacterium]